VELLSKDSTEGGAENSRGEPWTCQVDGVITKKKGLEKEKSKIVVGMGAGGVFEKQYTCNFRVGEGEAKNRRPVVIHTSSRKPHRGRRSTSWGGRKKSMDNQAKFRNTEIEARSGD